jgi:hypothetical protein
VKVTGRLANALLEIARLYLMEALKGVIDRLENGEIRVSGCVRSSRTASS